MLSPHPGAQLKHHEVKSGRLQSHVWSGLDAASKASERNFSYKRLLVNVQVRDGRRQR